MREVLDSKLLSNHPSWGRTREQYRSDFLAELGVYYQEVGDMGRTILDQFEEMAWGRFQELRQFAIQLEIGVADSLDLDHTTAPEEKDV